MTVWLLVTYLASQPAPELGPGIGGIPMSKSECEFYVERNLTIFPNGPQRKICRSMKWNPDWGPAPSMAEKD